MTRSRTQQNKISKTYFANAEKKLSKGDTIGAIVMLKNAIDFDEKYIDAYIKLADIYSDCSLNDLAINTFFRALTVCKKEDLGQIYGGLGINYYCIGKSYVSAYYINLQLINGDADEIDPQSISDFAEGLLKPIEAKDKFEFLSDIKDKEYKKISNKIHEKALNGSCEEVSSLLNDIPKSSKYYVNALNDCSLVYMLNNKIDEAISYAKEVLIIDENNFTALCNLSILYYYIGNGDKSAKYGLLAEKNINDNEDNTYHMASAYCEQGKYEKAIYFLNKMLEFTPYDISLYYLMAISYYNICQFENALKYFKKIVQITNNKRVAGYYIDLCEKQLKNPNKTKKVKPLMYSFQIPSEERTNRLKLIQSVIDDGVNNNINAQKLNNALDWCFSTNEPEIEKIATIIIASFSGTNFQYLLDLLIDCTICDATKKVILKSLISRGYDKNINIVFSDLFKKLKLRKACFIDDDSEIAFNFIDCLSTAYSEIAPLSDCNNEKMIDVAEELYYNVYNINGIEKYFSTGVFTVYIASFGCEDKKFNDYAYLCKLFNVDMDIYNEFYRLLIKGE